MLLSRTTYQAALFHLSFNPILISASLPTTRTLHIPRSRLPQTPSPRLYNILFPQCAPLHNRLTEQSRPTHTMNSSPGDTTKHDQATDKAQTQEDPSSPSQQEQLYLPDIDSSGDSQQKPQRLDLSAEGGSTVSLDHLGPMVVNVDGTLSRIGNWEQMTEIERKNTLRVLGKRNKQRLDALKAANAEQHADGGES